MGFVASRARREPTTGRGEGGLASTGRQPSAQRRRCMRKPAELAKSVDSLIVLGQRQMPSGVLGLPKTQAALEYATRVHDGQRRKADGAPFIAHPLEVVSLLYYAGAPDYVIAAGALHDTIEKTDTDASELRKRFGARVARLVVAVCEVERIAPYAQRKAALRDEAADAGEEALMVLAADKVSKARELRLYPTATRRSRPRRLTHYRDCLCLLQERLSESPLVRRLETELEALSHGAMGEPVLAGAR